MELSTLPTTQAKRNWMLLDLIGFAGRDLITPTTATCGRGWCDQIDTTLV
jgi:hypothetical protein